MELGPGIAPTLRPLVVGRSSSYIEQAPSAREVSTVEKWETVRPLAPKYEKSGKYETCAFRGQSRPFHFYQILSGWLAKPSLHPTT